MIADRKRDGQVCGFRIWCTRLPTAYIQQVARYLSLWPVLGISVSTSADLLTDLTYAGSDLAASILSLVPK